MIVYLAGLNGRYELLLNYDYLSCRRKLQKVHYQPLNNNYGSNSLNKDNMNLYLAGEHEVKNGSVCKTWEGVNILESYYYARDNKYVPMLIGTASRFLLDSGAFTFMQKSQKIDWYRYVEDYAGFINRYDVKHLCKTMRGVKSNGQMTVAHLSGIFKENADARREFYKLIDAN